MPRLVVALICCILTADAASAQSMNIRRITEVVAGRICGPFVEDGDMAAAIRAAEAEGYRRLTESPDNRARETDPDAPPAWIELHRSHHGRIILSRSGGRGLCEVGMAEGAVGTIDAAAAPFLTRLGMTRVLGDVGRSTPVVVWRGEGRQAIVAPSPHHVPGSALTFSFDLRSRR